MRSNSRVARWAHCSGPSASSSSSNSSNALTLASVMLVFPNRQIDRIEALGGDDGAADPVSDIQNPESLHEPSQAGADGLHFKLKGIRKALQKQVVTDRHQIQRLV